MQLRLDPQYPALRLDDGTLQLVGIHQRPPPGIPALRSQTCCPPSPCARLSRARTTTRTPPRPDPFSRRQTCSVSTRPAAGWTGRCRGASHVHHFSVDERAAQLYPDSLATATPQTFTVASPPASKPGFGVAAAFTRARQRALHPSPYPPDWSWWKRYGASDTGSSRTASRLACPAHIVWQCRHVRSLSRLLPSSRVSPRPDCLQLSRPAATGPGAGSFTPPEKMAPRGAL